jgi:hypothetical protein
VTAAAALLVRLSGLGVVAETDHGALRLRPASAIPTDLLAELRKHKAGVLSLLATAAMESAVAPLPVDEYRARLALAAADPTRALDYLHGKASIVTRAATPPVDECPEVIPFTMSDDLVDRLAAVLADEKPWQRVSDPEKASLYFKARACAALAPLDSLARVQLVAAEEARALGTAPEASAQAQRSAPPDSGNPTRGSITLEAVAAQTAVLAVACTQCTRSGRYRVAGLIAEHGPYCAVPELRRILSGDCQKRGDAHRGCDVFFPELPKLYRSEAGEAAA